MQYRYLGRTGMRVNPICLGCMTFGRKTDAESSYAMVARAVDAGVNFIDTANIYGLGESDVVTGEAIKRTGKRDFLVLATKTHGNMHKNEPLNPNRLDNSRRQLLQRQLRPAPAPRVMCKAATGDLGFTTAPWPQSAP